MKAAFLSIVLLASSIVTFAQFKPDKAPLTYQKKVEEAKNTEQQALEENEKTQKREIKYSVSVGASVGTIGNNCSFTGTYIAPEVMYQINKKTSIRAGVIMQKYNFRGENKLWDGSSQNFNSVPSSVLSFLQSSYTPTERISLYSVLVYEKNQYSSVRNSSLDNRYLISIGGTLKITDNLSFGVQFSKRSENPYASPFYYNNAGIYQSFGF
jgi:hypothetical protein